MRNLALTVFAAVIATGCLAATTFGASAVPNPCKAVSSAVVSGLLGAPAPVGKLGPSAFTASGRTCTYAKGSKSLSIEVDRWSSRGGSPVYALQNTKKDASLGPKGVTQVDVKPGHVSASIFFVKKAYSGFVTSNAELSKVSIVAHALYASL